MEFCSLFLQPLLHALHLQKGKNKKYGIRKFDRVRSNVDYEKMGPLAVAFGDYIKILEARERIGTSESYFSALMSLLRFRKQLRLEDITEQFLYAYEGWMRSDGNSDTTIGIYLRNLRAIINKPKKNFLLMKLIHLVKGNTKFLQVQISKKL